MCVINNIEIFPNILKLLLVTPHQCFLEESYRTVKMQRYNGMTCFMFYYYFDPIYRDVFCIFCVHIYGVRCALKARVGLHKKIYASTAYVEKYIENTRNE